jgi:hypothetical protein
MKETPQNHSSPPSRGNSTKTPIFIVRKSSLNEVQTGDISYNKKAAIYRTTKALHSPKKQARFSQKAIPPTVIKSAKPRCFPALFAKNIYQFT